MNFHPPIRYSCIDAGNAVDWDHPLNKGRVAWWHTPMGLGAGSRLLDIAKNNHGTLTNGAKWNNSVQTDTPSVFFDGTNDVVALPSGFGTSYWLSTMTASAWFFATSVASNQAIMGEETGGHATSFVLEVGRTSGRNSVVWNNSLILTGTGVIEAGKWNRVVCVRSGSTGSWTVSLYLNGVLAGSTTTATNPASGGTSGIGARSSSGAIPFGGFIRDVSVHNRALSAAEVALDYNASRVGYRTPDSPLRWVSTRSYSTVGGATPKIGFQYYAQQIIGRPF
jgi:hypothetical protein